jgi:predicted NACHT family NTPase
VDIVQNLRVKIIEILELELSMLAQALLLLLLWTATDAKRPTQALQIFLGKENLVKNRLITLDKVIYYKGPFLETS